MNSSSSRIAYLFNARTQFTYPRSNFHNQNEMLVNYRKAPYFGKNYLGNSLTDAFRGKFYSILKFIRISELLNHKYQGRKFIMEFLSNFVMTRMKSNVDFIEKSDISKQIIIKIIPKAHFSV